MILHQRKKIYAMKTLKITLVLLSYLLIMDAGTMVAQQEIKVPLSRSGQPGQLNVSMLMGNVTVKGHNGNEVVIKYDGDSVRMRGQNESRNGMRRVAGGSSGFEISENNNTVSIEGGLTFNTVNFEILVPNNFSVSVSIVNGRTITVENVNGDHEINHVNGSVELKNVSGSAVVNTVNGNIQADFRTVAADKPMSFGSVHGEISVNIPSNTRFNAKMRSEFGEVFTDFDMEIQAHTSSRTQTRSNEFRLDVGSWVIGAVNGGGPEYMFKTLKGDILIRKK